MPNPFDAFDDLAPPAAPAAVPAFPGVISGRVNPIKQQDQQLKLQDQQLQVEGAARDETRTGIAVRGEERDIGKIKFEQANKLRDDFIKREPVKNYETILRQYGQAATAANNLVGDQVIINSFAAALNPTSTVMPGEFEAASQIESTATRITERLKKEFGWDGAGRISDEGRAWMMDELQNLAANANKAYSHERGYYSDLAGRYGYDPVEVVGPHLGEPYHRGIYDARLAIEKDRRGEDEEPAVLPDGSLNVTVTDDSPVDGNSPGYQQIAAGVGDLVEAAAFVPGLVANPVGTMIGRGLGYEGYTADLGQSLRDALGLPEGDQTVSAINQGAVGALSGGLVARGASRLANSAPVRNALSQFGATPAADFVSGAGAGAASELARTQGYGPAGQAAAGVLGGLGGYGAARAASALTGPRTPTALGRDAQAENVTLMPADAGGTGTRMASGAAGMTLGAIPMAEAAEASVRSAANARTRVAGRIGDVSDKAGAGQAAQRGARSFIQNSERRGRQLEDQLPIDPEMPVRLEATREALSEVIQGFRSNPELSPIWTGHERLRRTLEALTPRVNDEGLPEGGQLSWQDMRRLRTIVGQIVGQPGLAADGGQIAALRRFYGALTQDMAATAEEAGPRAATQFARVNQFWRGRESRIQNVLSGILGPDMNKGDEAAFRQINAWAKDEGGNFKALSQALRSMPHDEANTVRATIFSRLGRSTNSNQSVEGDAFSPKTFSTQWAALDRRAKNTLFQGEHRRSVDRIVRIMDGMKRADQFANTSRTSLGTNLAVLATSAYANPLLAAAMAGGSLAFGKIMSSPRLAQLLASTPASPNPAHQRRIMQTLGTVASREPILSSTIVGLQQRFTQAAAASPASRAAAEDERQEVRGEPIPQR